MVCIASATDRPQYRPNTYIGVYRESGQFAAVSLTPSWRMYTAHDILMCMRTSIVIYYIYI